MVSSDDTILWVPMLAKTKNCKKQRKGPKLFYLSVKRTRSSRQIRHCERTCCTVFKT
ncbi:hypothetical protein [Sinobaca sp. H24]|uniref:hypothetical protein n=1 Tax=Sinobaca sp. H24 TaxID=2923376 RepID=UPI0035B21AF7